MPFHWRPAFLLNLPYSTDRENSRWFVFRELHFTSLSLQFDWTAVPYRVWDYFSRERSWWTWSCLCLHAMNDFYWITWQSFHMPMPNLTTKIKIVDENIFENRAMEMLLLAWLRIAFKSYTLCTAFSSPALVWYRQGYKEFLEMDLMTSVREELARMRGEDEEAFRTIVIKGQPKKFCSNQIRYL